MPYIIKVYYQSVMHWPDGVIFNHLLLTTMTWVFHSTESSDIYDTCIWSAVTFCVQKCIHI